MKTIRIVLSLLLLLSGSLLFSQGDSLTGWYNATPHSGANFYELSKQAEVYFENHPEAKLPGGYYKPFIRWQKYWKNRVVNSETSIGNMGDAIDRYALFSENASVITENNGLSGADWSFTGPILENKQVNGIVISLAIDKTDSSYKTIFAGTNASGLWKTTDGGTTWNCVTDGIAAPGIGINDIAISSNDPQTIFCATGIDKDGYKYGVGLIKSINGGKTWSTIKIDNNDKKPFIRKVVINPVNNSILYALSEDKVYRSTDKGINWVKIFENELDTLQYHVNGITYHLTKVLYDIEFKTGDPSVIFIASNGIGINRGNQVYRKTTEVWKLSNANAINPNLINRTRIWYDNQFQYDRISLAISNETNILFFGGKHIQDTNTSCYKLMKYNIISNSWEVLYNYPNIMNFPNYHLKLTGVDIWRNELEVSVSNNNVFYVGGYGIDKIDLSVLPAIHQHITPDYEKYHVDTRALKILRSMDGKDLIFAGNDGGVSQGDNNFVFKNINGKGLYITQFYGLGFSNIEPELIGGGTQDNHGFTRTQNQWHFGYGLGDGYEYLFKPDNPNIVLATANSGGNILMSSTNKGLNWSNTYISTGELSTTDRPFVQHPTLSNTFFYGAQNIWKGTIDNTLGSITSFAKVSNFAIYNNVNNREMLSAFAISKSNPSVMYAAFSNPIWSNDTSKIRKKIFKTSNGGQTWFDISANLLPLLYAPITALAVHPDDPNKIWVGFGGFWKKNDQTYAKCWLSSNGGSSWSPFMETSLPDLPVNCLKIFKTNNVNTLFIGNDGGVWYNNNIEAPTQKWKPFNTKLPVCIVNDIEYIQNTKKLRVATFGRGIWETDIDCAPIGEDIYITSNTTWATSQEIRCNVIIMPGKTLTIQNQTKFVAGKGITVEKGGKLILNPGACLTRLCNSLWAGIRLKGNPNAPLNQVTEHGKIEVNNTAIIEYANIGILTLPEDTPGEGGLSGISSPLGLSGGIIVANGGNFKNNLTSIKINPCKNPKIDVITNCNFIVDNYITYSQWFPTAMIEIYSACPITFKNCKFIIDTILSNTPQSIGILVNNSKFTMLDNSSAMSQFHNLKYGIISRAASADKSLWLDYSRFNRCNTGVYISGMTQPKILRSNFRIMAVDTNNSKPYGGIYLDHCTGYTITRNNLYKYDNSSGMAIGMVINNSGSEANRVYDNVVKNMSIGILAQNSNRNVDGDKGLCIQCNDFYYTGTDIAVTSASGGSNKGIRITQGENSDIPSKLANNRFSHGNNPTYPRFEIRNADNCMPFTYYMPDTVLSYPTAARKKYVSASVSPVQKKYVDFNKPVNCPVDPIFEPGGNIDQLKEDLAQNEADALSVSASLQALVDGGSTASTLAAILASGAYQAWELYNDLMLKSPYLSDTVLKESMLNEDALPNALLFDVLLANPQAAKNPDMEDLLDQRMEPMPDEMLSEISLNKYITGAKESLESSLAGLHANRAMLYNRIVDYWLNDTLPGSNDSLNAFLERQDDINAKYRLVFSKLYEGDYNALSSVMTSVSTTGLDPSEQQQWDLLPELMAYYRANADSGLPLIYADSTNLQQLSLMASDRAGRVSMYARNILLANGLSVYEEPYILPSNTKRSKTRTHKPKQEKGDTWLKIEPNPARDYIIVRYALKPECKGAELKISDMQGRVVYKNALKHTSGHLLVTLKTLRPGMYIVSLTADSGQRLNQKLIIK